jgi:hypothetical protein
VAPLIRGRDGRTRRVEEAASLALFRPPSETYAASVVRELEHYLDSQRTRLVVPNLVGPSGHVREREAIGIDGVDDSASFERNEAIDGRVHHRHPAPVPHGGVGVRDGVLYRVGSGRSSGEA